MRSWGLFFATSALAALAAGAASAQTTPQRPVTVDTLIITADPLGRSEDEVITNVEVLRGDRLTHQRGGTLGETLQGLTGVNADTYGGGAGRPVIRGQTAPRVQVLSDGASPLDASEVSPDHAVNGEPLLLRGVEILRGPSALIYGGGAIGGAVNLLDEKVPTRLPADTIEGAGEVRMGTADDEQALVIGATAGGGGFAFRLEGATRRTNDYAVPFFVPDHDGHEHEEEEDEEADAEEGFDRLAGSFSNSDTWTFGGSWLLSDGYFGLAWTEERRDYGLPGHLHAFENCHPEGLTLHCEAHEDEDEGHVDGEEEPPPVVDLLNRRLDVRGEFNTPFAGVERIRLRGGVSDYRHHEIEDGQIGTTFINEGHDLRVEVQHAPIGGLRGVIGLQTVRSDFAAIGEEAFLAPSRTERFALFVVETFQTGAWRFEGAARTEWQSARALGAQRAGHEPFSVSAAASWAFAPDFSASLTLSRSQRAPNVQELYADGIHLATNTYEIGDPNLSEETVVSTELRLRRTDGPFTWTASLYRYDYDGYIFAETLDREDEFRLIRYSQDNAAFTGFELEAAYEFSPWLSVSVFADQVRAKLDSGEPLPRIPAGSAGVRADFIAGIWSGDVEYVRVFEQDRIAPFETLTPGHDMIGATLAYDFAPGGQIYVRGTNLLDELTLNHASFLTNLAPLRGRNLVVGVRTRF